MLVAQSLLALSLLWVAPALTGAAGPTPGDQPPAERAEQSPPERQGRDQVRRRLREELESYRKRLDSAVRLLDEGGDPAKVREDLERAAPWGGRSGGRPVRGSGPRADGPGRDGPEGGDRPAARPLPGDERFDMSPEERADILRFLDESVPRVATRLRELDQSNPDLVTRLLTRMRPRVREVTESGPSDPRGRELRLDEFRTSLDVMWARRALDESRGKDAAAVKARRDELRATIGSHFDAQAALQEHEADRLVQRVERLRKDITERRRDRDEIVERELDGRGRPGARPDRRDGADRAGDGTN